MNDLAVVGTIDDLARTAKMLMMSNYFDAKGDADTQIAQLATRILAGRELGFGPFASVNSIHIIQGKPVIGANLMASAVKSNPHYDYFVSELTNDICRLAFYQNGKQVGESRFTIADAKAAGLMGKDNWKKYPRNMLFARAMSNGVKLYCPDVFNGNAVYTEGEIEAEEWSVVEPPSLPPTDNTPPEPEPDPEPTPEPIPEPQPTKQPTADGFNKFVNWTRTNHADGGPASDKQYKFLAGVIDQIVGDTNHKQILSKLLGADISSKNVPSAKAASNLLDVLLETVLDDNGEKQTNPTYRPDAVAYIKQLNQAVMSEAGQDALL